MLLPQILALFTTSLIQTGGDTAIVGYPLSCFRDFQTSIFNKQDDRISNGKKDETRMTAKILKQDPKIQKVKTNAVYDNL